MRGSAVRWRQGAVRHAIAADDLGDAQTVVAEHAPAPFSCVAQYADLVFQAATAASVSSEDLQTAEGPPIEKSTALAQARIGLDLRRI